MNEREMLELAAKANGMTVLGNNPWPLNPVGYFFNQVGDHPPALYDVEKVRLGNARWTPLADDGDALRLAVKLGMEVYIDNHPEGCQCVEVESHTHKARRVILGFESHESNDAATRYAITLCAAEIGRQME